MNIEPIDFEKESKNHPKTENCKEMKTSGECIICGFRDCPHGEPLHYHHDGCPACINDDPLVQKAIKEVNKKFICTCLICKAVWAYPANTDEDIIRASCSPCGHQGCFTCEKVEE